MNDWEYYEINTHGRYLLKRENPLKKQKRHTMKALKERKKTVRKKSY